MISETQITTLLFQREEAITAPRGGLEPYVERCYPESGSDRAFGLKRSDDA